MGGFTGDVRLLLLLLVVVEGVFGVVGLPFDDGADVLGGEGEFWRGLED